MKYLTIQDKFERVKYRFLESIEYIIQMIETINNKFVITESKINHLNKELTTIEKNMPIYKGKLQKVNPPDPIKLKKFEQKQSVVRFLIYQELKEIFRTLRKEKGVI